MTFITVLNILLDTVSDTEDTLVDTPNILEL